MEGAEGERALPFGLHALPNVGLVTPGYVAAFHLEFDKGKKEDIKPGELHKVRDPPPPGCPSFSLGREGRGRGRGGDATSLGCALHRAPGVSPSLGVGSGGLLCFLPLETAPGRRFSPSPPPFFPCPPGNLD